MQNPPVPEPSNPNGYEAYPSAPSAGGPTPSYSQASAYSTQGQSYTPPTYDAQPQGQGYTPPSFGAQQQAPGYSPTASQGAGFFKALFDLSFSNFITLTFAKIIYVVLIAVSILVWLAFMLMGFYYDSTMGFLIILFGWIPAVVNVVLVRLGLESSVALIRVAQNTSDLVAQGKKG